MGYEHFQRTLTCFLVFSIALKLTLYVLIFSASSGSQLIDDKGQRGRSAKFLRIFDTEL